jgi:hypothetical protein
MGRCNHCEARVSCVEWLPLAVDDLRAGPDPDGVGGAGDYLGNN